MVFPQSVWADCGPWRDCEPEEEEQEQDLAAWRGQRLDCSDEATSLSTQETLGCLQEALTEECRVGLDLVTDDDLSWFLSS